MAWLSSASSWSRLSPPERAVEVEPTRPAMHARVMAITHRHIAHGGVRTCEHRTDTYSAHPIGGPWQALTSVAARRKGKKREEEGRRGHIHNQDTGGGRRWCRPDALGSLPRINPPRCKSL